MGHRDKGAERMHRRRHRLGRRGVEHGAGREYPLPVGVTQPDPGGDPGPHLRLMAEHAALGYRRGARGVEHDRRVAQRHPAAARLDVVRRHQLRELTERLLRQHPAGTLIRPQRRAHGHDRQARAGRARAGQIGAQGFRDDVRAGAGFARRVAGQQHPETGVPRHVAELPGGEAGVDRDRDGAGEQDAEQGLDELGTVRHEKTYPVAAGDPHRRQRPGHPGGPFLQLPVRPPHPGQHQRVPAGMVLAAPHQQVAEGAELQVATHVSGTPG